MHTRNCGEKTQCLNGAKIQGQLSYHKQFQIGRTMRNFMSLIVNISIVKDNIILSFKYY